jgi:16S rRNA (guanine527-N7)-methyltransferase
VRERREPLPTRVASTPSLTPAFDDVLTEGLRTLAVELDPAQRSAIEAHVRLLLAWTQAINLTAIHDPVAVAREHVLDSLSALPQLRARPSERVLDLGSGGGFPGIPLAVALPDSRSLLVESVGKKARFLEAAVGLTGLTDRVRVAAVRAESLAADGGHRARWSVVVARAVASLAELVEMAMPLLTIGGALVAWKRLPVEAELERARVAVSTLGGGRIERTRVAVRGLEDHVLVSIEKVRPTPFGFPRDPAQRKNHPL